MRGGVPLSARLMGVLAAAASGAGVVVVSGSSPVENLSPTGRRESRVYGYHNIRRHLQRQKRTWGTTGSLADHPHEHKREIARRLRQAERNAERQRARFDGIGGNPDAPPRPAVFGYTVVGVSRRGRYIWAPRDMSALAAMAGKQ